MTPRSYLTGLFARRWPEGAAQVRLRLKVVDNMLRRGGGDIAIISRTDHKSSTAVAYKYHHHSQSLLPLAKMKLLAE